MISTLVRLSALAAAVLIACAPPKLVADPAAPSVHHARLDQGTIEVRAEVGRKPTEALPRNLTPIKITIKNTSDRGVHISLDEILLSESQGKLRIIPIEDIHLWRPEPTVGLLPGAPPGIPGLVPLQTKKNLRIGSPEYFTLLRGKHPEKKVVEQSAFKGGYIEAGQTVSGYVYFEPVTGDEGKVRLEVKVRSGAQSGVLTETEIPFAVEE
jgi:hypothetical protein